VSRKASIAEAHQGIVPEPGIEGRLMGGFLQVSVVPMPHLAKVPCINAESDTVQESR
jgi:hypothetical protein